MGAQHWVSLASRQGGAVSRRQLLDLGIPTSRIDRWVRTGRLEAVHAGVYVVAGTPDTTLRRRWSAHLAVGPASVLSFESAARVHRISSVPRNGPTVLTVPHSGYQRLHDVRVHQISDLADDDVERHHGLPVTSVRRTIVDLAAIWRPGRLGVALDDAVAARTTTFADVGLCLRSVARRGKPGVRRLAAVLDARGPGAVPPASELERAFFTLLDGAGPPALTPPARRRFGAGGRGLAVTEADRGDRRPALAPADRRPPSRP